MMRIPGTSAISILTNTIHAFPGKSWILTELWSEDSGSGAAGGNGAGAPDLVWTFPGEPASICKAITGRTGQGAGVSGMKTDRIFLGFTFLLSLLAGVAAVLSLGPAQTRVSTYEILVPLSGEMFDIQIPSKHEADFEKLLTQDPRVIHLQGAVALTGPGSLVSEYMHIATRRTVSVKPYVRGFFRAFFLVWGVYFVVQYLIRHLIIREFRKKLSVQKRKTRRGGRYAK